MGNCLMAVDLVLFKLANYKVLQLTLIKYLCIEWLKKKYQCFNYL